ncbi:MAG: YidC/Oxa1 family membrane protein insertase, partial [Oscillospiraceae bacterium]|nr:YidC/Oxa1 family membrane protein insertase [Oscillospiraceae bacterium]
MSFSTILYTILISPLQFVFEVIFVIANRIIGHPAYAIIFLSLAMNFLVLPLYRRADAMQEEARDLDQKLGKGVKHIKSTFSGDEKMMILQTYYRQNNYSPVNGLKGSVSLLLEIPFFIAAYQFLSHLIELNGVSFGPIADLSAPDALITIGALSVNVLPILKTAINLVSSAIFLKGFPLKSKIQLYGMALFFLVFLYNSPAGLVFYWTLNNTFSLVKTIFYKIPNPRKVLSILASAVGVAIIAAGFALFGLSRPKLLAAFCLLGLGLQLPVLMPLAAKRIPRANKLSEQTPDKRFFTYSSCFIALLTGALIPSTVISASPTEFINPFYYHNPLLYILMASCLAGGFFLIWFRIFYGLAGNKGKIAFEMILFAMAICMPVNYMFFGTDFGRLSANLIYTDVYTLEYTNFEQMLNLALMAAIILICCLFVSKKRNWAKSVMLTLCIAAAAMSAVNVFTINKAVIKYNQENTVSNSTPAQIKLSKEGNN